MGIDHQEEQTVRLAELFQLDQNPPPDPPAGDDEGGDNEPPYGTEMPYVQCGDCDFYVQGWDETNNGYIFRSHPCAVVGGKTSESTSDSFLEGALAFIMGVIAFVMAVVLIWNWVS